MKIAKDKKLHFLVGVLLSALGFFCPILFCLGFVAGVLKEFFDYFSPNHNAEILDCVYTWIGSSIPLLLWIITI